METFLATRPGLEVLALGEPTHGEPAFPRLRNHIVKRLVAHGFRSIAVESDRIAALAVDDYVRGFSGTLDDALATGFSHRLGEVAANRELLTWMRTHNESVPAGERLSFHGFDAPLEMVSAPSPGPYLRHLSDHLGGAVPDLDRLIGDDTRWSSTEALMDAAKSVGRSADAVTLRIIADDLLTLLDTRPAGPGHRRARLYGETARWLLRYHAVAADPAPGAERTSLLLGVRDAWMARNLLDLRVAEHGRGPTLVFAHNRHLQRHPSTWHLAGMDLEWQPAGATVSATLGRRYAFVAGSLGASVALGLGQPAAGTFEAGLSGDLVVDAAAIDRDRAARPGAADYFPLDASTVAGCDAVWHVDRFPAAAEETAARLAALPEVAELVGGPEAGTPEMAWDERFYFVGPDRRNPFATIVGHDLPGFDDESRLDRIGVFRLNVELGRIHFEEVFGYPPKDFPDHRDQVDFAALDRIVPHPVYATHGWASVLNPGPAAEPALTRLLANAHRRATDRARLRETRRPSSPR
ncbi:DUF6194 family protein [Paractinoplanes rishiriensis]|uniref:DUF6194 domain-containing protein n=1 Tax=Paractinoplanes rishiriensis TaxID=1050105 RepID=A0A919JSU3_9ACTN|nr:DUF6194 family protein [Actinoplanes rishiriensis]GIE92742.1 hypothetical protein Ari01nite_02070 [Actinoplanes rishiriensis]